jgi:hypothetical protein
MPGYVKLVLATVISVVLGGAGFFIGLWVTHVERQLIRVDTISAQLLVQATLVSQIQTNQSEMLKELKEINGKIDQHMFQSHKK